ncbi:MAG TPA: asparagine synthetase B, partial [Dehalococcoidia bacterium]|nr:asparagine synthetase B [Dehalococcoidia bacterium]
MCGFAGFISLDQSSDERAQILSRMGDRLAHRGPDDKGSWTDVSYGLSVVHRRLSVVDLSPRARQPMLSRDQRYVIAYNGEIYNFRDIRTRLIQHGYEFNSDSDTEVILASLMLWGLEKSLGMFFGMFAFALFDRQEGELILVRDRIGEKPLYYGWQGSTFLFGSELKALRVHPSWQGGIDREALSLYFQYRYIPSPLTIHPNIHKLEPGAFLRLKRVGHRWDTSKNTWWSYKKYVNENLPQEHRSPSLVADSLDDILRTV